MHIIADKLTTAKKENRFLNELFMLLQSSHDNKIIVDELVLLHNSQTIDILSESRTSENISKDHLFSILHLLELTLPYLETSVEAMMTCIKHLVSNSLGSLAPDAPLSSMIDFFSAKPTRPQEAIAFIINDPQQWHEFLAAALIAGAQLDINYYLHHALQLKNHENIEIRKRVIFSWGMINYKENHEALDQVYSNLKQAIEIETDDSLLEIILKSAFNLDKNNPSLEFWMVNIITLALSKSKEQTLQILSELLRHENNNLPQQFLEIFVNHIKQIPPDNKVTLKNIDIIIFKLLQKKENENVIKLLEEVILSNLFSINLFDTTIHGLAYNHPDLLNKLATRWLRRGEAKLCLLLARL